MYNIENNEEPAGFVDPVQVSAIESTIESIDTNGTICRGTVLALEEFLGTSVVTAKINPNMFTALETTNCAMDARAVLMSAIKEAPAREIISREQIIHKIMEAKQALYRLNGLFNELAHASKRGLDPRLTDDKYILYYNSNDVLCNLLDTPLVDIAQHGMLDRVIDVEQQDCPWDTYQEGLILIDALVQEKLCPYSLSDIKADKPTLGQIIKSINRLSKEDYRNRIINNFKSFLDDAAEGYYEFNVKDTEIMYKKLKYLIRLMTDQASVCALKLIINTKR